MMNTSPEADSTGERDRKGRVLQFTESDRIWPNLTESDRIWPNLTESDRIWPYLPDLTHW